MSSTHYDILSEIKTTIDGLSLSGLSTHIQDMPYVTDQSLPCVTIAPYGTEQYVGGTNVRDDWAYMSVVSIIKLRDIANFDDALEWRETILKAFHNHRPTSTGSYEHQIRPMIVVHPQAAKEGKFVSSMVVITKARKTR